MTNSTEEIDGTLNKCPHGFPINYACGFCIANEIYSINFYKGKKDEDEKDKDGK